MPPNVLVHLIEPAAWRAALTDGAVRPPSLDDVGFVHLSNRSRCTCRRRRSSPAGATWCCSSWTRPGSSDPVRFEPGMPADPAGMRFPHLYGPLPVTAVIAVVPYRPPSPVSPAGAGRPARPGADIRHVRCRSGGPSGSATCRAASRSSTPTSRHSRDNNRLLLTDPVDAATVETAVDEVAGNAGWPHRTAALTWPGAGDVAAELSARGWSAQEFVLMARPAAPIAGGDRVEIVAETRGARVLGTLVASGPAADRSGPRRGGGRADRPGAPQRRGRRGDGSGRPGGRPGRRRPGQLRVDGATAAVDSVLTDPGRRGRGHADAILARAVDLAAAAGCDLVVLEAAAEDWPRHWYARRGFEVVGSVWEVLRPA